MNNITCRLHKCRFALSVGKADEFGELIPGSLRDAGEHPNLILDAGLSRLLAGDSSNTFQIGTGNTAVNRTQTTLAAHHSGFGITGSATPSVTGTDEIGPYIEWYCSGQSAVFGSAVNIAEIGFGWGTSGATLISRALTRDAGGTPTVIPILGGEILVVTYYFRLYLPQGTASGTITVTTDGVPASIDWTSVPRVGQTLGLGGGTGLDLLNLANAITVGGASRSLTRSAAVIDANGASLFVYWNKAGNSGDSTITGFTSVIATVRSIPVDIALSPSYVVSNDQKALIGFRYYLTQDYS
ncbi:hypothetical protein D3C78_445580 [compost metagenome]